MKEYIAEDKNVKALGTAVKTYIAGLGDQFGQRGHSILEKHGITDLRDEGEYPMQSWLDAMKDIHEIVGDFLIYKMGTHIPTTAKFPPEIDSAHAGLGVIDMAYHMNHTEGEIGNYTYEKTGDKAGRLVCTDPYPCDFDRGIIEAMARQFEPEAEAKCCGDECRKKGGNKCTYEIHW